MRQICLINHVLSTIYELSMLTLNVTPRAWRRSTMLVLAKANPGVRTPPFPGSLEEDQSVFVHNRHENIFLVSMTIIVSNMT